MWVQWPRCHSAAIHFHDLVVSARLRRTRSALSGSPLPTLDCGGKAQRRPRFGGSVMTGQTYHGDRPKSGVAATALPPHSMELASAGAGGWILQTGFHPAANEPMAFG